MKEFTVIIERDEDGWYVSSVLEFQGCHTQGKTLDELMERTKEAIEAYLEAIGEEQEEIEKIEFVGIQKLRV